MEGDGAISGSPSTRIAVVTGGNRGIGLEVCRQLAESGVTVVLTARDETKGLAAVEKLREMGLSDVVFHQLEITDASSVARLAGFLQAPFGRLDILVNNAAVGGVEYVQDPAYTSEMDDQKVSGLDKNQRIKLLLRTCRETYDSAEQGLRVNYHGTKLVTDALLPLLQASSDGRIVNVSSDFGQLRRFRNEELKRELDDVENLTVERLEEVLGAFLEDLEAGELEAGGWPAEFSAYKVAKAAVNAYSRILARRHPALRVNCVDPGHVRTGMTRNLGLLPPEDGAARVVAVALVAAGGPTGAFFDRGEEAPFV